MTKVSRLLALFIFFSSFFIIPASFFEVYLSSVACESFEGNLLFLQTINFHAERAVGHLQQRMYTYSSKHISNLFTTSIQREIQIKSLGLGFKCASQLSCSQEWAKSRHGHKHPNNVTFEFEVCYFNFRCFYLKFDMLQNKMNYWLKSTLSQTTRLNNPLNKLHEWILSVFSGTVPLVVACPSVYHK